MPGWDPFWRRRSASSKKSSRTARWSAEPLTPLYANTIVEGGLSLRNLSKKQIRMLRRILIAAGLLIFTIVMTPRWESTVGMWGVTHDGPDGLVIRQPFIPYLYFIAYLIIGRDVLWKALRNIRNGQVFDENLLMAVATIGAFATAEYAEAVFVMLFYQIGELFQDYAVGRSRRSIAALMDLRPETANLEGERGEIEAVYPEDVEAGAVIVVKPGERIPLDGVILSGSSWLDTAALTGESVPRAVSPGDTVISGCVNQTGLLRIQVTHPYGESTVARILELVENASEKKAVSEQFISRFARYYTPCVVIAALLLAVLPPLFVGNWAGWFHRALIFLVISCPCALVISVPLSFFGGIGGASKQGILVKGGSYLEALAQAETVVFDKTGTLTRGSFTVTEVDPEHGFTREDLLETAALAEQHSSHPIALSLKAAWGGAPDPSRLTAVEELAGHGVRAVVDGKTVCVGSRRLMEQQDLPTCDEVGTVVHVSVDGLYAGRIVISDLPKEDAAAAIAALKRSGVKRTVMLTGDTQAAAERTGAALGLDEVHAQLLPDQKAAIVEQLLAETSGTLVFVGDGINDAPVLTRADVGIAMGALGSDAAIEAADIVLMDDKPAKIVMAIRISRKTLRIVRQNIWLALGVKFGVLLLGALGLADLWMAVFADVGVAFLAILNAMRCLSTKDV